MTEKKPKEKKTIKVKSGGTTGSVGKKKGTPQPVVVDVKVTVLPPSRQRAVHPAMHFDVVNKRMFFGFQLPVEVDNMDGKPTKRKVVQCLVDEKGVTIPCIESELRAHGITLMSDPLIDVKHGNRMSDAYLEEHQRTGGKKPVPWPLPDYLEFVVECLKEMIDFSDDDYFYYLALWIFGTYCHRLFESFPYDFYNGPTGTGKTRTLEVCEVTAFNGILSPNMSPSSLFRTVESRAPTLLMDETEKLWSTDAAQEIRQLVLSGYKRGAAVMRTEKVGDAGFQTKTFGTYSPKAFANISGLDDVLANRCISQLMTRSKEKGVMNARLLTKARRVKWQDIRNQSYLLIYRHWLRIADIVEANSDTEVVEGVNGRPLELWGPIFALAQLFEENGCTGLMDKMTVLAVKMVEEMNEAFRDSPSGQLIMAIKFLMMKQEMMFDAGYYRFQDLIPEIAMMATFAEEGIEEIDGVETTTVKVKKPRWLTPNYVTRQLKLLGLNDFKGSGTGRQVYLTKAALVDLWERYMGEWEEPEPAFNPQMTLTPPSQGPLLNSIADKGTIVPESGEDGEQASQDSARAKTQKPPLTEDVLILLLSDKGWTSSDLKDECCKHGYRREEFDPIFNMLKEHPNMVKRGQTPIYYRWKEVKEK